MSHSGSTKPAPIWPGHARFNSDDGTATFACLLPALRASLTDPAHVLGE